MMREIPYAHGTMPGAERLEVYDGEGARLFNVVEANSIEGWYVQIVMRLGRRIADPNNKGRWLTQRIKAPVRILQSAPEPEVVDDRLARAEAKRRRQAERQAKGVAQAA